MILATISSICGSRGSAAVASFFAGGDFTIEHEFDRTRVDDYAFGITRAAGAVAESGTIVLNDATTSRRLAALAPWVHVAVVERAAIFSDLTQAVARNRRATVLSLPAIWFQCRSR